MPRIWRKHSDGYCSNGQLVISVCSVVESTCDPKNGKTLDSSLEGSSYIEQINGQDSFTHYHLFRRYPYFLPGTIAASIAAASWLVTLLFLKEVPILSSLLSLRRFSLQSALRSTCDLAYRTKQKPSTQPPVPFSLKDRHFVLFSSRAL